MKRVLTGIFGLLLLLCLAEANGQPLFQKNYGESSSGFGIEATIQTQDSGFVSTGYWNELVPLADPGQPPFDIYLLKSDQAGRMQWVRGYGRSGDQRGLQVRQHGNKGFYILARDDTAYMVLKTDAQGDTLWARQYRSDSADITVRLRDMEMMDGGGVMVLGDLVQDGREDLLLTRLTPSGALSWSKRIGKSEPLNEQGVTMAPASNGDYFLAGKSSNQNASAEDLYVLQVDSAGNVKWARTYIPLGTDESLEPEDIESTSDGGAIVAGLLDTSKLGVDPLLVRIAPGGDTLWTRIYGGTDRDVPRSVVEDPNGGYYLGANSNNKASSSGDLILYKTKENGDPQWGRAIGSPFEYEWAETMIRAANGDFLYAAIRENRFAYFRASGTGDNPCITSTSNLHQCRHRYRRTHFPQRPPR